MHKCIKIVLAAALLGLVGARSSSSDSANNTSVDNSGNNGGDAVNEPGDAEPNSSNATLLNIAGAAVSSQPMEIDVTALQADLNALDRLVPVAIEEQDTVSTLLEKAQ